MSIDVHEFLNPKSTMTPGILASFVAFASGAFFVSFQFTMQFCMLAFSLFFACFVFLSKEFQGGALAWYSKAFLYIANTIVVFTLATGMHAVFDRQYASKPQLAPASSSALFAAAYAADEATVPTESTGTAAKQSRPFFLDWTDKDVIWVPRPSDQPFVFKVDKAEVSGFKSALAKAGLLAPDYRYKIGVVSMKSGSPLPVKKVTYFLLSKTGTFDKSQVMSQDAQANFEINVEAWSNFLVRADIELADGRRLAVDTQVSPSVGPR
jgi:hypothetical protein